MKGSVTVIVRNAKTKYEFTIKRNITVIKGNSATGKTTLIDMIREHNLNGEDSGIELYCSQKCVVIEGNTWKEQLALQQQSIVFIDEGNRFTASKEFAAEIRGTDNYYVLATRENLVSLPYSVEEIYGIRSIGKYSGLNQIYHEFYHIYTKDNVNEQIKPEIIVTEDSNAGYQFFESICGTGGIACINAAGKSNIIQKVKEFRHEKLLVIADGAAFGPEMEAVMKLVEQFPNIAVYLPESFEWIILMSGCLNDKVILNMSNDWGKYIESKQYFSWEQFFTDLLITRTHGTYLQYSKKNINHAFLKGLLREKILNQMEKIDFSNA